MWEEEAPLGVLGPRWWRARAHTEVRVNAVTAAPVRMLRHLSCLLRGGHRWEKPTDLSDQTMSCSRCGKVRHSRTGGGGPPHDQRKRIVAGDMDHTEGGF